MDFNLGENITKEIEFGGELIHRVYQGENMIFNSSCPIFVDAESADTEVSKSDYRYCDMLDGHFSGSSYLTEANIDCRRCKNINSGFTNDYKLSSVTLTHTDRLVSGESAFKNCSALTSVSLSNTQNLTTCSRMFYGCTNMKLIGSITVTSAATDLSCFAYRCYKLTDIDMSEWNTLNVIDMQHFADHDALLTGLTVGENFNTSSVIYVNSMFGTCRSLLETPIIDCKSMTNMNDIFDGCSGLTKIHLRNFGTQPTIATAYMLSNCPWGVGSDEAKNSVIESLLTYSFDRKTAGYTNMTIGLKTNAVNLLTSEEISAIAAKEYVIKAI
jgi:surface protein